MKTQDIVVGMVVWYKFNESARGTGGEIVKVFEQAGEKYFDVRYSRTDQIFQINELLKGL